MSGHGEGATAAMVPSASPVGVTPDAGVGPGGAAHPGGPIRHPMPRQNGDDGRGTDPPPAIAAHDALRSDAPERSQDGRRTRTPPGLVARGVAVSLGRRQALRGVDLDARPGEVTAIVGPNGSGKTTLLCAVSGEIAHAGSVSLGGLDVAAARPWELARLRAVLPQETALAFHFTALEVVRLGLRAGVHAAREEIAAAALARVGLAGFEGRLEQELSGGERQRVHLARVLAQVWEPIADDEPRWLMLDEPVAGLDLAHQLLVMEVARDFAAAGGGVLAVLHDLNLTAMAAQHVLLLRDGRALAAGPPEAVLTDDALSEAYACTVRTRVAPGGVFLLPQAASLT